MPSEVTYGDAIDAGIDAAHVLAGGFLPEPYRSAVHAAIVATVQLLRPDLILVEVGPDTVVTVEAE